MYYAHTRRGFFLERPNRFIARVMLDGKEEIVHVKNTGRCAELLRKNVPVILEESSNKNRKTRFSLIAVYKNRRLINIDSQIPNAVVVEGMRAGKISPLPAAETIRREVTFGNSRFDIYFEASDIRGFIEVKGVTLEQNDIALFPDAPTERGTKHVYEMIRAVEDGYMGCLFFLIQMNGIRYFTPNRETDPRFAEALTTAYRQGVRILAYDSVVRENEINIGSRIPVIL